jgi:hypothetical protein
MRTLRSEGTLPEPLLHFPDGEAVAIDLVCRYGTYLQNGWRMRNTGTGVGSLPELLLPDGEYVAINTYAQYRNSPEPRLLMVP